jgi:CHAT domain-containing protein
MERGLHDGWHFTGHAHAGQGNDADQAAIELTNGDELKPEDIVGNVERMLQKRPFIFFNACQSAQAGLSLTGLGGWARRFIQPSTSDYAASAFIGSYWAVYDEAALGFAKKLYEGLIVDRKPIGQAAQEARLAILKKEDPTWLAYTVYADPFATVKA